MPQDDSRIVPKIIFVWFNSLDVPIDIKRMYQSTANALEKRWNGVQHFQVSNATDFSEKWLNSSGFTAQFLSAQHLTALPKGETPQIVNIISTPGLNNNNNNNNYDSGAPREFFAYGTKFNPNTGEPIPKFDPYNGRQNW